MDLFGGNILPGKPGKGKDPRKNKSGSWIENPMHEAYGVDELKRRCKSCIHVYVKEFSKRYYKCELWSKGTASPSDDHKANWIACGKFKT